MKSLIIIPTYNESENIKDLLAAIYQQIDSKTSVLIVDDNSPDGTGNVIDSIISSHQYAEHLFVLHRSEKSGLGKAYIAGFNWGLERGFDYFVSMDADFSHNPSYLPRMLKLLKEKGGCIIGSRYVSGGSVRGWPLIRKIISFGGSLYARLILLTNIHDFTGGFNGYTRQNLQKLNLESIVSAGYCFQIEMKFRHTLLGQPVNEFPIVFTDRTKGKSKMCGSIFKEAILNVLKLSLTRNKIRHIMKG